MWVRHEKILRITNYRRHIGFLFFRDYPVCPIPDSGQLGFTANFRFSRQSVPGNAILFNGIKTHDLLIGRNDCGHRHLPVTPQMRSCKACREDGDEYTCERFTVQQGEASEAEIPSLANWTYIFNQPGIDAEGQVFGIDHSKFENLVDSEGKVLPTDKAYHVYNAFIDFHSFCTVFAERTSEGNGIQDLKKIGQ